MSIEQTLNERGSRYGDFRDHAAICQQIKSAMYSGPSKWLDLPDTHKQSLEVIADKIARILSGDPNYADNWHDIQGYAKLVEDRLPKAVVRIDSCVPYSALLLRAVEGPDVSFDGEARMEPIGQNGPTAEHYGLPDGETWPDDAPDWADRFAITRTGRKIWLDDSNYTYTDDPHSKYPVGTAGCLTEDQFTVVASR